jgi:photoactive yellow protein
MEKRRIDRLPPPNALTSVLSFCERAGVTDDKVKAPMDWNFAEPGLLDRLETADDAMLDTAPFGVVAMTEDGTVTAYNAAESRLSGLTPDKVVGRHFFSAVAPCTNNFMVAYRFETESFIDAVIDYVFTLRMQPTKVRLRLLKQPGGRRIYLVVERA